VFGWTFEPAVPSAIIQAAILIVFSGQFLAVRYLVVTADSIDFHGFERSVWPEAADQISSFEKLIDAAAYYEKLTGSSKD
jgi:hypothetical protein